MQFRYNFGEKLDVSRFKKQAPHYISLAKPVEYDLYLPHYRLRVEVNTPEDSNGHDVLLSFSEITRDGDGEIIREHIISPANDSRFKEFREIKNIFTVSDYKAAFNSNSSVDTVDKICSIIKILSKINNLTVFL